MINGFLKRKKDNEKQLENEKCIEFYSACINGWIETKLERDKNLLTLSSSGIGILVTLLTTVGIKSDNNFSTAIFILYILALFSFIICIFCIVKVFESNASHIEKIVSENLTADDVLLLRYDTTSKWSFLGGVVFAALIGIFTSEISSTLLEKIMTNSKQTTQNKSQKSDVVGDSLANLGKLSPKGSSQSAPTPQNSTQKK